MPAPPVGLQGTLRRNLEKLVSARLGQEPVIVLNGARTVGKSTLLRSSASARGTAVLDLDDSATRAAVAADPSFFVRAGLPEPVCIDEFQHVLPLLEAIKAELNRDLHPGRYILTGSTRYATLPAASQSLAGRVHVVTLWPLSQGELRGREDSFLATLTNQPENLLGGTRPEATERGEYEAAVLAGGFPLALAREPGPARRRWFRDYVNTVLERDVLEIRRVRQRGLLPRVLRHLASQTAQILNMARVAGAIGVDRNLVTDYTQLLESVFLVHRLEAFGRTLSTRVQQLPKIHLVDSGLGAQILGVTAERLSRADSAMLTEFGHLLETFVVNELIKQGGWTEEPLRFSHYRTRDGAEVDLVIESDDGRVFGIEVKASATVNAKDFRGLIQLRDKLGVAFVAGVVLHLGMHAFTHDDRLLAMPIDRLWC